MLSMYPVSICIIFVDHIFEARRVASLTDAREDTKALSLLRLCRSTRRGQRAG